MMYGRYHWRGTIPAKFGVWVRFPGRPFVMKICCYCHNPKPYSAYHKNKRRKDGVQTFCKDCGKVRSRDYYRNNKLVQGPIVLNRKKKAKLFVKEKINILKRQRGCGTCDENEPACIDFHHRDGQKSEQIAEMIVRGCFKRLLLELAKCITLCANCHRKYHAGLIDDAAIQMIPTCDIDLSTKGFADIVTMSYTIISLGSYGEYCLTDKNLVIITPETQQAYIKGRAEVESLLQECRKWKLTPEEIAELDG